ncbi:MAG: hypothetical protein FD167_5350, partial [bacterium]
MKKFLKPIIAGLNWQKTTKYSMDIGER